MRRYAASWAKRGDSRVTHLLLHDDRTDVLSANTPRRVSPSLYARVVVLRGFLVGVYDTS